jgi:hypothetical protein
MGYEFENFSLLLEKWGNKRSMFTKIELKFFSALFAVNNKYFRSKCQSININSEYSCLQRILQNLISKKLKDKNIIFFFLWMLINLINKLMIVYELSYNEIIFWSENTVK